jgi:diguanylate cyclase (GGDEF)-like protein/PAS domain S-box-containing protein
MKHFRFLSRLPLQISLPLVQFSLFAIYAIAALVFGYQAERDSVIKSAQSFLQNEATRLARQAELDIPVDPSRLIQESMRLGAQTTLRAVAVALPDGKVVAAHRSEWVGNSLAMLWPAQMDFVSRERQFPGTELAWDKHTNVLVVRSPFSASIKSGSLVSEQRGTVLLEMDVSLQLANALHQVVTRRLLDLGVGLLFVLALAIWLFYRIGQPVARLSRATSAISEGKEVDWKLLEGGIGELHQLAVSLQEMTDRLHHQRHALHVSGAHNRLLSQALEQSPESILITDPSGCIQYVNQAFERVSGYSANEVIGQNPRMLKSGRTFPETYAELWDTLLAQRIWEGELVNRTKDGSEYTEWAIIAPVRDHDGNVTHYLAVKQEITEKKAIAERISYLIHFDPVTDLPNRTLLNQHMTHLLALGRRRQHLEALLLLNLDRFKTINDAQGQAFGDAILFEVGRRLKHLLREADTLARLTADEFAVLLPNLDPQPERAARQAFVIAEKIQAAFDQPLIIEGETVSLTTSLGITLFPLAENEISQDIFRRADTALHRAKHAGGNQTVFFETGMDAQARAKFSLENELRRGVLTGELRLYLQPKVYADGQLAGAEALVRWQHPERGLVPPNAFIPLAEESDLIVDLGSWVLAEACQLMSSENFSGRQLQLSVNLSPRQFRKPGFVPWLKDLLAASGADPTCLTLEVTEGMMINDVNEAVAKMKELAALGIRFSVDDFGTGYSSLAYLKRLPIHELKIDRTFIQDAPNNSDDAALVETILSVARHMQLNVVAEGVETEEQAAFLNKRASVIHQGFLYGKPGPAADWVSIWRAGENPI